MGRGESKSLSDLYCEESTLALLITLLQYNDENGENSCVIANLNPRHRAGHIGHKI